ncbi:MAG: hypothetical protein ACKO3P_17460 [Planctomycetaceae bacterium]
MPPPHLLDFSQVDFSKPIYDIEAIRRVNPQRNMCTATSYGRTLTR